MIYIHVYLIETTTFIEIYERIQGRTKKPNPQFPSRDQESKMLPKE